jgi:hypothetical protein
MEIINYMLVGTAWWWLGFIPGVWACSAMRRSTCRAFPDNPNLNRPLWWSDLKGAVILGIIGPAGAAVAIVVAIAAELSERPKWLTCLDRPIFTKK